MCSLSGGDPLTLRPKMLDDLLAAARDPAHRVHSHRHPRARVSAATHHRRFVDMLRKFHPLWMNIHLNHPEEITPEVARACAKLADAGIPLGNQSVC